MELRHLRYFVAVAEELNFRRAAERLFMAQPPLSAQIHQLEAEIGALLFHRGPRRVTLTAAGVAFLEDARAILARAEAATARARRIGRGDEGRLRVGFASSAVYDVLPLLVRTYRERHPNVELELTELLGPEQTQALHERRIDVGLTVQPEPSEGVVVEEVAILPLVVALPANHPLSSRPTAALQDLDGQPFIRFPRTTGSGFSRFVSALFDSAGIAPKVVQETEELQTAVGLVAAGLGFTLVPGSVRSLSRDGLVFREFPEPAPTIRLGVTYREGETSPLVPFFLAVARETANGPF